MLSSDHWKIGIALVNESYVLVLVLIIIIMRDAFRNKYSDISSLKHIRTTLPSLVSRLVSRMYVPKLLLLLLKCLLIKKLQVFQQPKKKERDDLLQKKTDFIENDMNMIFNERFLMVSGFFGVFLLIDRDNLICRFDGLSSPSSFLFEEK